MAGQFGGLVKLGSGCCHATSFVTPSAHMPRPGFVRPGSSATACIVVANPACQAGSQFRAGLERVQIDAFVFQAAPQTLDDTLSIHRPRPSIEIRTPVLRSTPVNPGEVN
jgi:hypothetical protein